MGQANRAEHWIYPAASTRRVLNALFFAFLLIGTVTEMHGQAVQSERVSTPSEGLIQPGDEVVLEIWREPDMSGTFKVDESGVVTLPRLGRIDATTVTGPVLQDSIQRELGRYLRNPSVKVTVLRRIGVHGEVRNPSLYMIDLTMTLRDVIASAGGITDAGDPNSITIVRDEGNIRLGEDRRIQFMAAELRSGDQVVVGRRSWIAMNPLAIVTAGTALISIVVGIIVPLF